MSARFVVAPRVVAAPIAPETVELAQLLSRIPDPYGDRSEPELVDQFVEQLLQGDLKLCECGCGQRTPLAAKTSRRDGHVRGEPLRYVHGHNRAVVDHVALFWSRVEKTETCWLWTGQSHAEFGYGLHRWRNGVGLENRPLLRAHRIAWELTNGPITDGLFVLHSCDNPPCCNPAHLFLGTSADNTADMMAKGRHRTQRRA